jgi:vitamin B12 transporter
MYVLLLLPLTQVAAKETYYTKGDSSRLLLPVHVKGVRYPGFYTGYKFLSLDSNTLLNHQLGNLSDVLAQSSNVFVKSYGPGMLSTPGFRGGNANHTAILWNGFNLQSALNGQTDLALIPSFLLESAVVQYGSQAVMYGSGNIGGAVHLQTDMETPKLQFLLGGGSFGTYAVGLKSAEQLKKLFLVQKLYVQQAENNFTYYDEDLLQPHSVQTANAAIKQRARNARMNAVAWLQEYQYAWNNKHQSSLRTWVQLNNRQLPQALQTPATNATQNDINVKLMLDHKYKVASNEIQGRFGYFHEELTYEDALNGKSESESDMQVLYLDYFKHFERSKWQVSGMAQHVQAGVNSIKTAEQFNRQQYRVALFSSYQWTWFNTKLQQQISGRQEWVDGAAIPFTPAYGFSLYLHKYLAIYGNVARSYRLPSFNDLYWPRMGNINLLPEQGWNEELSLQWKKVKKQTTLNLTATGYNKNIQNWIVWVPKGGGLSTPMNVYKVWSRGLELTWLYQFKKGNFTYTADGLHEYNSATNEASQLLNDASIGKQLIYTPRLQHRAGLAVHYKKSSIRLQYSYTGLRFVSSDELNWLAPYKLFGVGLNQKIHVLKYTANLVFTCNNLFNTHYQIMVNRPMPLFNYQLTLNIQL